MSTKTYFSAFFPAANEPGRKGSTVPVVTTGTIGTIQNNITGINQSISDIYTAIGNLQNGGFGDTTPPSIVTGFTLTSQVDIDTDGSQIVSLTASWNANTATDLGSYVIALKEGAGSFIEFTVGKESTNYYWSVRGNRSFTAKITAVDKAGNRSAWTSEVTIQSAKDTVPPTQPTNISVETSIRSVFLRWINSSSDDFTYTEIFEGDSTVFSSAIKVGVIAGNPGNNGSFTRTGLTPGQIKYYFLRSVDSSGNLSTNTNAIQAATVKIAIDDFVSGLTGIEYYNTLPVANNFIGRVVLLTTDNKLYRWTGSVWTPSIPANDITGQITNTQITDNAITTDKIAANSITGNKIVAGTISSAQIAAGAISASKLLIGNSDNIIPDSNMQDPTWWGITGNALLFDQHGGWTFSRALRINPGSHDFSSQFFPVEIGATYKIVVSYWTSPDFSGWLNPLIHMPSYAWYSIKNGTGQDPELTQAGTLSGPNQTISEIAHTFTNPLGIVNNANRQWQFRFRGNIISGYTEIMVKIIRVSDATLIQDGAIFTSKLAANAVTTDKLTAGAITTDKLAAGAITTDKLSVGTINAAYTNLIDLKLWDVSTTFSTNGPIDNWTWNQTNAGDNFWINNIAGPYGTNELIMKASSSNVAGGAGGWLVTIPETQGFKHTKSYRYYCWINIANVTGGSFYHGLYGAKTLAGVSTSNPYFFSGTTNTLQSNKWYLMMGIVHSSTYQGIDSGLSGLYDPITGARVVAGNDFKFDPTYNVGYFRTYHYYANPGDFVYFTQPVLEEISPRNVSIAALLYGLDYASSINTKTTTIQPGKISIAGATTLADWRSGSDITKIEGGAIGANTISANKLTIGNRGIGFIGLNFEWDPTNNFVYWSDGYIYYTGNNGSPAQEYITAGNSGGASAHRWFYWTPGTGIIQMTNSHPVNDNSIFIGAWWGGSNLNINYGGTIINGDRISTNTIHANRVITGTITADKIAANTIGADKLAVNSLSAITANIGLLRTATTGARMELENNQQRVYDQNGTLRVKIGYLGT